ncbi:SPFH domain-containing protein [Acholeplasma sp. OttesenSCG-928-E16]|nr:SPFH domain-containing protein [Acholeplasma sp. OttesenSCG-928-E16]
MGLLKVIEWKDDSRDTLVYKYEYNIRKDFISKGSALTVREGQAAIFVTKGKMADVFLPGFYKLDTENIPLLTKLMSWKYGFESPFKDDVYFVNTRQFPNQKWGTQNPIMIRDEEFGPLRVRAFGTYSFRIDDPYVFMTEISGTIKSFQTKDIVDYLRSMVVTGLTDAVGESKIPILDMAANVLEMGQVIEKTLQPDFKSLGLELTKFNFENFSVPEEVEKALDRNAAMGVRRSNIDVELVVGQIEAMKEAAKNPGTAGGMMGAGLGLGFGANMGGQLGNMAEQASKASSKKGIKKCAHCGAQLSENSKFCPECGKPTGSTCPKCKASVAEGAKFCPECGESLRRRCPKCGADIAEGAKFCPECGEKL